MKYLMSEVKFELKIPFLSHINIYSYPTKIQKYITYTHIKMFNFCKTEEAGSDSTSAFERLFGL